MPDSRLQAKCVLPATGTHHRFDPMIRMVSTETVHRLVQNEFAAEVDNYLIIDCRFPFEYEGGHITGAVNYWNVERGVHSLFVEPVVRIGNDSRTVVIFHCEFSSVRAPTMLKVRQLRHCFLDHLSRFPQLHTTLPAAWAICSTSCPC